MRKGLFITFEGGEGAGKTTLIEEIEKTLHAQGLPILKTREPGGTHLGEKVRELLLQKTAGPSMTPHAELCLFLASRAQHIAEVIGPALQLHNIVLCDRFNDSSIAYQGHARGLGLEPVSTFCNFISQGLTPDLTLYLDIDPQEGLLRAKGTRAHDRIESETLAFHTKIREGYHLLHKQHPERLKLIHAGRPPNKVFEEAMDYLAPLLKMNYVQ
ncbi:MAG: dTMP kinase [Verrucomicrobiota bacterium]|nr:dTMP kinase [Verrucomicrobiota bacterium]